MVHRRSSFFRHITGICSAKSKTQYSTRSLKTSLLGTSQKEGRFRRFRPKASGVKVPVLLKLRKNIQLHWEVLLLFKCSRKFTALELLVLSFDPTKKDFFSYIIISLSNLTRNNMQLTWRAPSNIVANFAFRVKGKSSPLNIGNLRLTTVAMAQMRPLLPCGHLCMPDYCSNPIWAPLELWKKLWHRA